MDPTPARRLVDHSARLHARVARTAPRNGKLDVAALSSVLLDWLPRRRPRAELLANVEGSGGDDVYDSLGFCVAQRHRYTALKAACMQASVLQYASSQPQLT